MEYLIGLVMGLVIGFMLGLIISRWAHTGIKDDVRRITRECRHTLDLATSRLTEAKEIASKVKKSEC